MSVDVLGAPGNETDREAIVRRAYMELERSDPGAALRSIAALGVKSGPLEQSIDLVARGWIADAVGDAEEAARCFDAAFALGVQLPALLLRIGVYYLQAGEVERGFNCLMLAGPTAGDAVFAHLASMPESELSRYALTLLPRLLLEPWRPAFFAAHPIKRALVNQIGVQGAAITLGAAVGQRFPPEPVRLPLASMQEYAEERARVYEELTPRGRVELPRPEVLDSRQSRTVSGIARSFYFALLEDVVVSSKSNFLLTADRVLMDSQGDELGIAELSFDVDPLVLAGNRRALTVTRHRAEDRMPTIAEALSLVGAYSSNDADWIVDKLVKLFAALTREGFENLPVLVDQQMPPQHRESLAFFLGPDHPIVSIPPGASVEVSRLWVFPTLTFRPGCEEEEGSLAPYDEVIAPTLAAEVFDAAEPRLRSLDATDTPDDRLYLLDPGQSVMNAAAVNQWFAERGFTIFNPADHSFVDVLRLIRNAHTIVTHDGPGAYRSLLGRNDLRLGILAGTPMCQERCLHHLAAARGMRSLIYVYPQTGDDSGSGVAPAVDLDALARFVDRLEAD